MNDELFNLNNTSENSQNSNSIISHSTIKDLEKDHKHSEDSKDEEDHIRIVGPNNMGNVRVFVHTDGSLLSYITFTILFRLFWCVKCSTTSSAYSNLIPRGSAAASSAFPSRKTRYIHSLIGLRLHSPKSGVMTPQERISTNLFLPAENHRFNPFFCENVQLHRSSKIAHR